MLYLYIQGGRVDRQQPNDEAAGGTMLLWTVIASSRKNTKDDRLE